MKSEKGFTLQDLTVAVIVISIFVGTLGSIYLAIYKVQAQTKVDSVAALFTVQIMERIDKVGYDEINSENIDTFITNVKKDFSIPSSFHIDITTTPYGQNDDLVKLAKLTLTYSFDGKEKSIMIQRPKVREIPMQAGGESQ